MYMYSHNCTGCILIILHNMHTCTCICICGNITTTYNHVILNYISVRTSLLQYLTFRYKKKVKIL